MFAAVVGNSRDYELTRAAVGEERRRRAEPHRASITRTSSIATAGGLRGNLVPWPGRWAIASPTSRGPVVKSLIIQNVATGSYVKVPLETIDDSSPGLQPDGKRVIFAALQNGIDIWLTWRWTSHEPHEGQIADFSPAFSPDGKSIVYAGRVNSNDKLFQLDLATGDKKQLTFGTHDDTSPKFFNAKMLVFTSTAIDPKVSIPPEVARNANIPNVWTLDVTNGQLQQLTDTMSGNISPVARGAEACASRSSAHKGERIHTITGDPPSSRPSRVTSASRPIAVHAGDVHTLVPENIQRAGSRT
jgi:hypothetical protein